MKQDKAIMTTTFQLPIGLHNKLKLSCHLTRTSMGEFIRISIRDKINSLKVDENK